VINTQDLEFIKETGGHVPQNKRETLTKIIQLEKGNFHLCNFFRKPLSKERN